MIKEPKLNVVPLTGMQGAIDRMLEKHPVLLCGVYLSNTEKVWTSLFAATRNVEFGPEEARQVLGGLESLKLYIYQNFSFGWEADEDQND